MYTNLRELSRKKKNYSKIIGFIQASSLPYLRPLSVVIISAFLKSSPAPPVALPPSAEGLQSMPCVRTSVECLSGDTLLHPLGSCQMLCFWVKAYPGRQESQCL